ncbi:MAG: polysaccharide deacetylase family protein [Bacilli bacterium]|nr:polysaccharide deacetylase family protein [Bacilli bacterium]
MKKYIFIIITTTVIVTALIYFYDTKEKILNKKYINNSNNIYIEYPYFNNTNIDKYINNYLMDTINNRNNYHIFMDYDYNNQDNIIDLSLYTYKEKKNIIKKNIKNIEIDLNNKTITSKDNIIFNNYDFYNYKIVNKSNKMVALTFDDGPSNNTSRVLDILDKYNVKATFFVLGTNIKGHEQIIKRMINTGHQIGNHMYSHKLVTRLKDEDILNEIKKTDKLVYNITNKKPEILRPSYGSINRRVKVIINKPIINWDIDTLDWKYHNSKRISRKVVGKVKDGDIVLMHDIYTATSNSLDIIIPKLLEKGYKLVTINELFYYKNKKLIKGNVYRNIK